MTGVAFCPFVNCHKRYGLQETTGLADLALRSIQSILNANAELGFVTLTPGLNLNSCGDPYFKPKL